MSTGELSSYFSNHALGRRFPWSLYHAPIDRELQHFLRELPRDSKVLNVGCGLFLNLPTLPTHVQYTGCDLDPRAVAACAARFGAQATFAQAEPLTLPFPDHTFDALYATEVIEHLELPEIWLKELMRVVKPGGQVLLTTPNYGSISLKLIESTALELIARAQGFSRHGIHPFPLNPPAFAALVRAVGGSDVLAKVISLGWVITLTFRVPSEG